MIRSYSELVKLPSFEERLAYLSFPGSVGVETFGFDRYLNQKFYKSLEWKRTREAIFLRDNGCDLGVDGYGILDGVLIHHINPISIEDFRSVNVDGLLSMENLITTSSRTHRMIHFGSGRGKLSSERRKGDTSLWQKSWTR